MMHCEILSEEFFGEFYADTSDCPSDIYINVSEDGSSSEHSSDSDDVNIRWTKGQKNNFHDWFWYGRCRMKLKVLESASTEEWI